MSRRRYDSEDMAVCGLCDLRLPTRHLDFHYRSHTIGGPTLPDLDTDVSRLPEDQEARQQARRQVTSTVHLRHQWERVSLDEIRRWVTAGVRDEDGPGLMPGPRYVRQLLAMLDESMEYSEHREMCAVTMETSGPGPCDCGLDELRREVYGKEYMP